CFSLSIAAAVPRTVTPAAAGPFGLAASGAAGAGAAWATSGAGAGLAASAMPGTSATIVTMSTSAFTASLLVPTASRADRGRHDWLAQQEVHATAGLPPPT